MDVKQFLIAVVALLFGCVLPVAILVIEFLPELSACSVAGVAVLIVAVLGSIARALCQKDEDEASLAKE